MSRKKKINGTEINSFPFIDFVALQSHVHSLSYFSPFCGLLMGSPVNTRAPQRQEGPGLLPREGTNCSPGKWVCWPQACHLALRGEGGVCVGPLAPAPALTLLLLPLYLIISCQVPAQHVSAPLPRPWVALGHCFLLLPGPHCIPWQPFLFCV